MKKWGNAIGFFLALLLPGAMAFAQAGSEAEQLKEINRQVWLPFLEGVRKNEDSLYLNVHLKDFIRLEAVALEDLEPFRFANSQQQIDRDVWIPFMAASNAFDAEGFLTAQSKDLVRVAADSKEVYGLERYQTEIRAGFKRAKERGIVRQSEARFLVRIASGDLAFETGYFRSQTKLPGGEIRVRYSKFEFVLRKEGGRWKILLDKDTAEAGTITEEMFQAATPIRPPK